MKFRKKSIEIEAMPFLCYQEALPKWSLHIWLKKNKVKFALEQIDNNPAFLIIETLEGAMKANIGDWIIKGIKGEIYPCKPDIFEATYDKINPPPKKD